jgi:CrcB protein
MSQELLLATVALGALGALARYFIHLLALRGGRASIGTLLVNVMGSGLAGGLIAMPESFAGAALLAGLCGSLTTFSTLVVQLLPLPGAPKMGHRIGLGAAHVVGSIAACAGTYGAVALWLVA